MDDQPGVTDQYRQASPWPLFVALGLAIAELGVLFGSVPLTVGGILLLGGSVAGILRESDYTSTTWRPLVAIGGAFVALGAALWGAGSPSLAVDALVAAPADSGVALRGASVVAAGVLLVLAGTGVRLWEPAAEP